MGYGLRVLGTLWQYGLGLGTRWQRWDICGSGGIWGLGILGGSDGIGGLFMFRGQILVKLLDGEVLNPG